jgi:two-component system chemotaxis sensor kinase CheA
VKTELLDTLMRLSEELLIGQMRIEKVRETVDIPELSAAVDSLGRVITDLQYNVMQSRMVPLAYVFERYPRMVRDIAKREQKEVDLKMEGMDIELDRTVVDEIGECLVHLLRNAIDHGIETPAERKKSGKPAMGTIRLSAKRARDFSIIEVSDDGAGLDLSQIKDTAVKKGLVAAKATKEELIDAIFFGASTTKEVSEVSGRGFGLNIVKKRIESLGGSVTVTTEPKKGTTFMMEVPLSLAIIETLFVGVGGATYAIPVASIERLITVDKKNVMGMIDNEAVILNGESIPVTRLDLLFNVQSSVLDKQPIVIVRRAQDRLGLAVDSLMETQEIVIKPLHALARRNKYLSGSTIIGSGEVVSILDVGNLLLTKRNIEKKEAKRETEPAEDK